MADKKILLQKKINGELVNIYPKTIATIVDYVKGTGAEAVTTTVAAELASLESSKMTEAQVDAKVKALEDKINGLADNESLVEAFDTLKEIGTFLDEHDESIGALADLITDVGVASKEAEGGNPAVTATGLHADVESLESRVDDLETANGTNVTKTYNDTAAANGHLFLDGTDTTVYDDTDVWASVGRSTDTAAAAGTTAWSRILEAEGDIDDLEATVGASTANADANGTTLWSRLKNAETDIDTLEGSVGASTDAAATDGTTLWSRLKALESVQANKVEAATNNGYIKVDNVDNAVKVYDDADLWASVGRSSDTASAAGTTAWSRILEAEGDIDDLEAGLGAATDTANASGTTAWSRVKNAESDIDTLEAGLGAATDTAASDGTTAWSRIKAIEAEADPVQLVSSLNVASADESVLYMVEIQ